VLNIFRSNISLVMFALPLVMVLTWLPDLSPNHFLVQEQYSPMLELWGSFSIPIWVGSLLNFVFVLLMAILVNLHFNEQDYLDRQVFLPSVLFVIFWAWFGRHMEFTLAMPAMLFIILYHGLLTKMRKGMSALGITLESSLVLGVAVVLYWPVIMFVVFNWVYLLVFRPFVLREWLLSILGVTIVPLNFFGFAYGVENIHPKELITIGGLQITTPHWSVAGWIVCVVVLALFVVSFWNILANYRTSGLRFRKLISAAWIVMLASFVISVVVLFLTRQLQFFLMVNAAMCIPVSWYLARSKPNSIGDILVYLIFAVLVVDNLF